MKLPLFGVLLVVSAVLLTSGCTQPSGGSNTTNAQNQHTTLIINADGGKSCNIKSTVGNQTTKIILGEFNPPYAPNYQKPLNNINLSQMRDAIDAQYSARGYGWDNYLTLLDENYRTNLESADAGMNNTWSKSFNDNIGNFSQTEYPVIYTHWIEITNGSETRRIIVGEFAKQTDRDTFNGTVPIMEIVKTGDKWLQSSMSIVGTVPFSVNNYSELLQKCS